MKMTSRRFAFSHVFILARDDNSSHERRLLELTEYSGGRKIQVLDYKQANKH